MGKQCQPMCQLRPKTGEYLEKIQNTNQIYFVILSPNSYCSEIHIQIYIGTE